MEKKTKKKPEMNKLKRFLITFDNRVENREKKRKGKLAIASAGEPTLFIGLIVDAENRSQWRWTR